MLFMFAMMVGVLSIAPWSDLSEVQFTAMIYTPLQTFAFVAMFLPRMRKLEIASDLAKRNLIVAAYMPALPHRLAWRRF